MKILIAEDAEVTATILRRTLTAMGHEVAVAADGAQAWRMHQAEHRPLIISDWMMPNLDGPSLCRRIRCLGDSRYTYIILTTVRSSRADRMEGLRAGADDFLTKPIDSEELIVRIEIAARIIKSQERMERREHPSDSSVTDERTGLCDRREFRRALEMNFAIAARQRFPLSLALLDIDQFKSYSDAFGPAAGESAIRAFAEVLQSSCGKHELASRDTGEVFAVILPGSSSFESRGFAVRFQESLASWAWPHRPLTASIGIATSTAGLLNVGDLVERAASSLQRSKNQGRGLITHSNDDSVVSPLLKPKTVWPANEASGRERS